MTPTSSRTPDAQTQGVAAATQKTSTRQSLTRAGCLALLARGGHGRVAATMRAVPIIIPVSFRLLGDDVIFSPGLGEGLSRAIADSVVAFEADQVGSDGRALWDVHVTGVARTFTHESEAPGFRLSSEIVTGWRTGG
jgi:nitroimidazol reductase NimA-like FMN-containing flavoprotein (pyridoxamine 5'-phosphate oxidase superfamily)